MSNSEELKNQVAIITGAASGIGKATAERFSKEGAYLVLNDINAAVLEEVVSQLSNPDQCVLVPGDISLETTVQQLHDAAIKRYGKIDILVNNAGIHWIQDITETSTEEFDQVFSTNVKSMFLTCKAVIPTMVQQKSGVIINLSSISAFVGQEMMGKSTYLYNMTKASILQLTRSLATRYGKEGIRVNCVAPGATKTNQINETHTDDLENFWSAVGGAHPIGRYGESEEVANCILFLASKESSFVTGSSFVVDGGYLAQ
ncbi:SDR family NAD(P)-dependent oxidoreductase [Peribacillus sp. NPDC097197]|uniref:SDR family NAD(P)-dependent oxidoreductase n=1 Tax=unclassified Peribacillus TaxID=2675266 RepID=UPI0038112B6D